MSKESNIENIRHSLSHLLAAAILKKYPDTKLGIGPTIETGFYYDFLFAKPINEEDLAEFEKEIKSLINKNLDFKSEEITSAAAKKLLKDQPFKLELIAELSKEKSPISIYRTGDVFTDLCRGPHVKNTKEINPDAFKLTHIAGAYWKGNEKNPMLTRIYGLAFNTKKELDEYILMMEEAKKRDHRELGKKFELFTFSEEIGQGLPIWLPNGTIIKDEIENLAKEKESAEGYQRVSTPIITKEDLFIKSGHLPHYKESMYAPMDIDGENYYLKPMNCPFHHTIYSSKPRSYRELPLRLAEYGLCHRYEKSGELQGLMRVRSLSMNDAHIYVRPDQVRDEIKKVIELHEYYYKLFGIKKAKYRLSLHDKKELGKKYFDMPEAWKENEQILREVLQDLKVDFYEAENEAAFYGPKIDIQIYSIIGKEYTLGTVQLDFAQPQRFNLKYIDENGKEVMPYVIHRAPLSTHERFIGFLIEHYAGAFPTWLSPVQAIILPISEKVNNYAKEISDSLISSGVRVKIDDSNETLGKKIRGAEMKKIPYILVVGEKEAQAGTIAVRRYGKGDLGAQNIKKFTEEITAEIKNRV
ncbi:MAG: threonine--tRNA ligase [Candidatus Pacebacteria bacterium]|nr:threonine--tRNA ligase [Candidatus Paceibacterota bacterium]